MHPSFLPAVMLVLSLLCLLPGVALAQSGSTLPGSGAPPTYRLMETPEAETASAPAWKPHPALRVAVELGTGALVSVGGGIAGLMLGSTACKRSGRYDPEVEGACVLETLTGLWLGSSLGFALGTWGGGSLMGGHGHLLLTLGGMALGLLVGVGSFQLTHGYINAVTGAALLTPYVFSVVAYELSSSAATPSPPPATVRLRPLLSVSAQGAVLGLGGSF